MKIFLIGNDVGSGRLVEQRLARLAVTIGADTRLVGQFDLFRKKWNIGGYERAGIVSDQEAKEMINVAERIRQEINDCLQARHTDLIR